MLPQINWEKEEKRLNACWNHNKRFSFNGWSTQSQTDGSYLTYEIGSSFWEDDLKLDKPEFVKSDKVQAVEYAG